MANTLSIYGGTATQGGTDGDLITTNRRLTLSGLRAGQPVKLFAFRAESADYPAVRIKAYFTGNYASLFKISKDNANFSDVANFPYVCGKNVLFWVRCDIPENMAYGTNTDVSLVCDYLGGV